MLMPSPRMWSLIQVFRSSKSGFNVFSMHVELNLVGGRLIGTRYESSPRNVELNLYDSCDRTKSNSLLHACGA